jgi:hypothetical protein
MSLTNNKKAIITSITIVAVFSFAMSFVSPQSALAYDYIHNHNIFQPYELPLPHEFSHKWLDDNHN